MTNFNTDLRDGLLLKSVFYNFVGKMKEVRNILRKLNKKCKNDKDNLKNIEKIIKAFDVIKL